MKTTIQSKPLWGYIAIVATGVLLGFIPLFKDSLNNFSPLWIVLFRTSVAFISSAITLLVLYGAFNYTERFMPTKKELMLYAIYGVVCLTAVSYFYIKSLTLTTVAISIITVFTTMPLTALVIGIFLQSESYTKSELLYIFFIVFGCLMVNTQSLISFDSSADILGMVYAALAGFSYGLYSSVGKKLGQTSDYPVMLFWQFAFAVISSVILLLYVDLTQSITISIDMKDLTANICPIFFIGFVSTFMPYFLYSFGLSKRFNVNTSIASILVLIEVISATIVAFVFLDEKITILQGFGMMIVVIFSTKLVFHNNK